MTKKEAENILKEAEMHGFHYKKGYCCYQEDHVDSSQLILIGKNATDSWNWSLFLHESNKIFYCSSYRNAPYHEF